MAEEAGRALWERLEAHHKAGYLSLHMPGHKENAALAPYLARWGPSWTSRNCRSLTTSTTPPACWPGDGRAAKLWGSRKSYFQVNGSTGGLLRPSGGHPAGGPGSGGPPLPQGCLPRH